MEKNSSLGFLEQFEKSERNISRWPVWARNSMVMASASYRQVSENQESAKIKKSNPKELTANKHAST